jgi:hypothetical protein
MWEDLQHVKEKAFAVTRTLDDIKNLRQLFLAGGVKQFVANVTLMLTYGLEQVWEYMTESYFTISKYLMVMYLKKQGLFIFMVPQLMHTLARKAFLIRELSN